MRKKLSLLLAAVMLAGSMMACGDETSTEQADEPSGIATEDEPVIIEEASEDVTDEIVEGEVVPDVTDEPIDVSGEFTIGTTSEALYTDQNANIQITVPEGWSFITDTAMMSSVTGEDEADIQALWDGTLSPLDNEISYVAIAYDENTGSNIIVSYHNLSDIYDEPMEMDEYIASAAMGMDGTTSSMNIGADEWATFTLDSGEDSAYSQMIMVRQADTNDMVMVLLTFTIMGDDDMDEILSYVQPLG